MPDQALIHALQLAALRGVDVRIMLPEKPDHKLVYLAAFSYIAETEPAGVKFYRYQPGFMHHKVILVDDDLAAVGTANFDNRSVRLNFEMMLVFADRTFAAAVSEMLEQDFAECRQATAADLAAHSFWFRFAVRLRPALMAPIARHNRHREVSPTAEPAKSSITSTATKCRNQRRNHPPLRSGQRPRGCPIARRC